eukprot:13151680-Ditylum_brightwellii.AAC.1
MKEADWKDDYSKEITVYMHGDDGYPTGNVLKDKSVPVLHSRCVIDMNCTAMKKVSLSVNSSDSTHVVGKYGSEVYTVSHPTVLPNSDKKHYLII